MKTFYRNLLTVLLCAALLCGCAANNTPEQENMTINTPNTENTVPDADAQQNHTDTVPDESGAEDKDVSDSEIVDTSAALTNEDLSQWESYFNNMENNGLLRFPYADLADDPDQLAPYLVWLFYDIGDLDISEEEYSLLEQQRGELQTDVFRLTRDFLNNYLLRKLDIPADKTENLLDDATFGTYLPMYDAWYLHHGDTEYRFYEFDRGVKLEDGTVKLHYFNDFLRIVQDNGEMDYIDAEMIVTLAQREDGTWYVVSHEIDKSTWNEQ